MQTCAASIGDLSSGFARERERDAKINPRGGKIMEVQDTVTMAIVGNAFITT